MQISVFIGTSLDRFIARPDGAIDWLGEPTVDGEDFGYGAFMAGIDVLVMGRRTYEKVLTFGDWPYEKPVVVMTSRSLTAPAGAAVEFRPGTPREVVEELRGRGVEGVYLDGGALIQSFLREGLVDRLVITTIPVLIGEGIPLFGVLEHDVRLEHTATRSFPDGQVQSDYAVVR